MSTDWSKYSTPLESRGRSRTPEQNAIVSLPVGGTRGIPLDVIHSPDIETRNRAHTDVIGVIGEKMTEIRSKLLDLCQLQIPIDS